MSKLVATLLTWLAVDAVKGTTGKWSSADKILIYQQKLPSFSYRILSRLGVGVGVLYGTFEYHGGGVDGAFGNLYMDRQ